MNTTASVPTVTSTIPTPTLSSSTTTTTTTTSTLSPTITSTSSPTSIVTPIEVVDLEIILPCAIIGGLILIVGIAILCYMLRRRSKQRKQPPPILPSFTVPDINDLPIQSDSDPLPVPPSKPTVPPIKPTVPPSKPTVPPSKPSLCDKPVLEKRESVASARSDGYFFPCPPPKTEIQDDPEYIDMTQQQSLPKPCGVANTGYVNDPKNPQTNIFTIQDTYSHYQNTGNYVPEMKPMETVHEYANVKNEIHEPISDILYENTCTNEPLEDDHQLLDYENAPAKLSPSNVNTNENLTSNNLITQIKQKPLPSPRTNCPKTSPRGSPRSKCSPRGSPHSKSSPQGSPLSKSSPRIKPEKYRGVKVM